MKKLFMLTLLYGVSILICGKLSAQQDEIVFTPNVKDWHFEGKRSSWDLYVNSKATKSNAAITVTDEVSVFHYLVDSSFHVLKQYMNLFLIQN
jgi:hypothetical protein